MTEVSLWPEKPHMKMQRIPHADISKDPGLRCSTLQVVEKQIIASPFQKIHHKEHDMDSEVTTSINQGNILPVWKINPSCRIP